RMLPAQQRLDAGDAPVLEIGLRLVMQAEFTLAQGLAQFTLQLQCRAGFGAQTVLIDLAIVAPLLLGEHERRARRLNEARGVAAVLRRHRQADTGAEREGTR